MLTLHWQHAFIDRKVRSRPAFMQNHLALAHSSCHAHITYSIMLLGFLLACSLTCLLTLFTSLSLVVCTLMAYHKCWLKTSFFSIRKSVKRAKNSKKSFKIGISAHSIARLLARLGDLSIFTLLFTFQCMSFLEQK